MKGEHQPQKKRAAMIFPRLVRPTIYFLLLLLAYSFGYFSSPSSLTTSSSSSSSPSSSSSSSPSSSSSYSPSSSSSYSPSSSSFEKPSLSLMSDLSSQLAQFQLTTTRCSKPLPSHLIHQTVLDKVFDGVSPFNDFPPPLAANLLHPKKIKGWGSTGAVFENLIQKVKPNIIIELGSFLGASATHMAYLTRRLGLTTVILCIDDFRGWPEFRDRFKEIPMLNADVFLLYQFMQNVVTMNSSDSVLPIPFSTSSALDTLCQWGIYGDLIEVDAGHDFNSAWSDINRAYRILRPGGVIFGHDYFNSADKRGVRRAVDLFAKINGLKIKVDGQHWVIDSA